MKTKGWEQIYREKGEVYSDITPQVKKYAQVFKARGYKKILDLGCGTGRHSIFLAQKGFQVHALDISRTGVAITRKKAESLGLNINFKIGDMRNISHPDDYFDGVICIFTLSHGLLNDNKKAIDEIYRVLKPGGMVITELMSTDDETCGKGKEVEKNSFIGSMENGEEDIIHHYFTKDEIQRLFSGFGKTKITAVTYFNKIKAFDVEAIKSGYTGIDFFI